MTKLINKNISTLVLIIATNQILVSSLYVPLLSPPKTGEQGGQLISTNHKSDNGLDCEPSDRQRKPTLAIELSKSSKKLPPCPPPQSIPFIDKKAVKNLTVMAGKTISVDLPYGGYPEPSIEFYRFDKRVYETDRIKPFKKLVIANASRTADQGIYTLIATNIEGGNSAVFTIEVVDKPSPPIGPLTANSVTPNSVTLSWLSPEDTAGSKIISYFVEKLQDNTWINVLNTSRTTKVVQNLNLGQTYKFRVRAVNEYGVSEPLVMNNSIIARGISSKPEKVEVVDHRGLVMLQWMPPKKDNGDRVCGYLIEQRESPNGDWLNVTKNSGQLNAIVKDLKVGKVYEFRVSAINNVGKGDPSKPTQPILIRPLPIKPAIDRSKLNDKECVIGSSVSYEAVIGGEPEPQFQWKLNGRPINEKADKIMIRTEANKTVLAIDSFTESQAGVYTLSINNSFGQDEASFTLKALKTAIINKSNLEDTERPIGKSVRFEAILGGEPEPEYEWKLNGKPINQSLNKIKIIKEGNKTILTIKKLEKSHSGVYTLSAKNHFREDKALFNLTVISVPNPPTGPLTVKPISDENKIVLSCDPPKSNGGKPITEYLFEKIDQNSSVWTFLTRSTTCEAMDLIDKNSTNLYRVKAINSLGESEPLTETVSDPKVFKQKFGAVRNACNIDSNSSVLCLDVRLYSNKPSIPIGPLEAVRTFNDSIVIKWSPPKEFDGFELNLFRVELFNSEVNSWVTVSRSNSTEASITGLKPNTNYRFRVIAVNANGDSLPLEGTLTTLKNTCNLKSRPEPPLGAIQSSNSCMDQVTLSWVPSNDNCGNLVKEYLVEKQDLGLNVWEVIGITSETRNRVKNLDSEKTYRFRVKAVNRFGESNPLVSDWIRITTTCTTTTTYRPSLITTLRSYSQLNEKVIQEIEQNKILDSYQLQVIDDYRSGLKTLVLIDELSKSKQYTDW